MSDRRPAPPTFGQSRAIAGESLYRDGALTAPAKRRSGTRASKSFIDQEQQPGADH